MTTFDKNGNMTSTHYFPPNPPEVVAAFQAMRALSPKQLLQVTQAFCQLCGLGRLECKCRESRGLVAYSDLGNHVAEVASKFTNTPRSDEQWLERYWDLVAACKLVASFEFWTGDRPLNDHRRR